VDNPTVSWEIRDENDRIISILSWVVVSVLVVYALVFAYKQFHASDEVAQETATSEDSGPQVSVATQTSRDRPRETRRIAQVLDDRPPLGTDDPTRRVGGPETTSLFESQKPTVLISGFSTPDRALLAMRRIDLAEMTANVLEEGGGYALRIEPFPSQRDAERTVENLRKIGMQARLGSEGVPPRSQSGPDVSRRHISASGGVGRITSDAPQDIATGDGSLSGPYYLQLVTYGSERKALSTASRMRSRGLRVNVEPKAGAERGYFTVVTGTYRSQAEAESEGRRIGSLLGLKSPIVRRRQSAIARAR